MQDFRKLHPLCKPPLAQSQPAPTYHWAAGSVWEQQRLLAGRIADGLQGRGIPPLHSLTGFLVWDQTGNKDILHPSCTSQRHRHNPHQFTHCLLSPWARVTLPSFICWKRRHSNFVESQHQSLGQNGGGCLGSLQLALLSSLKGAPTSALLCPAGAQWWHRESSCASQHQSCSQKGCRRRMLRSLDFCFCGLAIVWGLSEH